MTLPENFNSWEHFQDVWRKVHNKNVRDYFSDLGGDEWDPDISLSRGSARVAATMEDNDTSHQMLCRWLFFHGDCRNWEAFQTPIYGIPVEDFQGERFFRPQITLYFCENAADVEPNYQPVRGQISIRLVNKTNQTISKTDLNTIATKIKNIFATPRYKWRKGKESYGYKEADKLYKFKVYARTENDAKDLIEKILDIQNHTPDWDKLRVNKAVNESSAYPTNPGTEIILGETRRKTRYRPIADVYFVSAFAHIYNIKKPLTLVDTTGRFNDALESV